VTSNHPRGVLCCVPHVLSLCIKVLVLYVIFVITNQELSGLCMMFGLQISINQRYTHNAIYQNWAFAYNRSTMFLKSAKFQIMYNFFLNPYNVFDITTFNRTKFVFLSLFTQSFDLSYFPCRLKECIFLSASADKFYR